MLGEQNKVPDKPNSCDKNDVIELNSTEKLNGSFNEQEEWNEIESIMESFGSGFIRESMFVDELEKEFQSRLMGISITKKLPNPNVNSISTQSTIKVPPQTIGKWLKSIRFENWEMKFITNGFDDVDFIVSFRDFLARKWQFKNCIFFSNLHRMGLLTKTIYANWEFVAKKT